MFKQQLLGLRCVCGCCFLLTMSDRKLEVMIELYKEMNHEKWEKDSETFNAKFKDLERYSNSTQNAGTKCFKSIQPILLNTDKYYTSCASCFNLFLV